MRVRVHACVFGVGAWQGLIIMEGGVQGWGVSMERGGGIFFCTAIAAIPPPSDMPALLIE